MSYNSASILSDPKSRSCLCSLFVSASLICGFFFIGSAWLGKDTFLFSSEFGLTGGQKSITSGKCENTSENDARENSRIEKCNECRPLGSEALPKGIVSASSDMEMSPLFGGSYSDNAEQNTVMNKSLLAMAVGITQKPLVNLMVNKFLADNFTVMLFHYDGIVEKWNEDWRDKVIHISAINQSKWWFAKRFLHPDVVSHYEYVFLWDEDLGVEYFQPASYISIIREEGLEISQPALDSSKSEVHHQITIRRKGSVVHRRYYKFSGGARCYANSTTPPCVGWVEMMAPVFSRAAWRCVWYMIQNDLIHAWGLDMLLGYCAQGDRMVKVGVVDQEYIIHYGLPTLGGFADASAPSSSQPSNSSDSESSANSVKYNMANRTAVRLRSYNEMRVFRNRWSIAVKEDECWIDPFKRRD